MVCENSIECGPYPIRIFSSDTGSRPQKHECSRCFIAVGRFSPSGKSVQRSVGTSPDAKCLSILCFDIAMTVPLRYDLACRRRCLVPMPPCGCANEPVKGRPTFSVFRAATASGAGHLGGHERTRCPRTPGEPDAKSGSGPEGTTSARTPTSPPKCSPISRAAKHAYRPPGSAQVLPSKVLQSADRNAALRG